MDLPNFDLKKLSNFDLNPPILPLLKEDKDGLDKFFANDGFFNLISFNFPKIFDNLLLGPSSFGVSILSFKDAVGVCV